MKFLSVSIIASILLISGCASRLSNSDVGNFKAPAPVVSLQEGDSISYTPASNAIPYDNLVVKLEGESHKVVTKKCEDVVKSLESQGFRHVSTNQADVKGLLPFMSTPTALMNFVR